MNSEWITSPAGRRVLMHWADPRPAWLWSQDGSTLIWQNAAARLFNARIKKHGLKLSQTAVPIKGQVARLIRLGLSGRSSLSRVQLLAGDKPLATTCICTPLPGPDGSAILLLVGTEAIPAEISEAAAGLERDTLPETLLPAGADYLVVEGDRVVSGNPRGLEQFAPQIASHGLPTESADIAQLRASPAGATLIVYFPQAEPAASLAEVREADGESAGEAMEELGDLAELPEPMLPFGLAPLPEPVTEAQAAEDEWTSAPAADNEGLALSSLFDRLAEDASLYTSLAPTDEVFVPPAKAAPPAAQPELDGPRDADPPPEPAEPFAEPAPSEQDLIAAVIEYADDPEERRVEDSSVAALADVAVPPDAAASPESEASTEPFGADAALEASPVPPPAARPRTHWLITGRGFRSPLSRQVKEPEAPEQPEAPAAIAAPLAMQEAVPPAEPQSLEDDAADRVSRYNFEELGRILTDRVANEPRDDAITAQATAIPGGVVSLNAETLVLNRLPLAIMVFRDQQVLFANRALTHLLGYDSVASLRAAGIAAIFPRPDATSAGPVNQLVRRDGALLPVGARLQSVSWQGRAALMLSASPLEPTRGHEGAVKAFAELAAETREEGFIAADRAGLVTRVSATASGLLGMTGTDLVGRRLAELARKHDVAALRDFLEKPARFAETARPHLRVIAGSGDAEILLFSEGQAGLVSGYFGFVRPRHHIPSVPQGENDLEPSMLGRLSRGLRRPLNTVIGFADLIRSAPPGALEHERVLDYARDIRTAGLDIAVLVDELDDFARLREGEYAAQLAELGLASLLEECMARVRPQAAAARVLVRSAISTQLPRIRADEASLSQALLNLLASAIDQTPVGGSVILSAQSQDDGSIAVHVRDGAANGTDLADRFVVFRDGIDKDGEELTSVRSTVGLALTRSLLAVNACSLSVDPTIGTGTLFSLMIPADLITRD